ncbi:MAG: hypothetical protein Q9220_004633 [cf. Caloplaca sp. 1 TL-2023]
MNNPSRSPSSRGLNPPTSNLTSTGRSSPVRGMNGITRSARGSVKKPASSRTNTGHTTSDDPRDHDVRAEHQALMEELRERVSKAETLSEEYQRQLKTLQSRLDDSLQHHGKIEDQLHESEDKVVDLESTVKQAARLRRELEDNFESERNYFLQSRAEQSAMEEQLRATNQRLKDTIAERDVRSMEDRIIDQSASPSPHPGHLQEQRGEMHQKDKLIESLRLELTGSQIKIMELENVGGSRLHDLEKKMLDMGISNARLMEENESFQLLLSQKTLNGDFTKTEVMQPSSGLGSLAEELESAEGQSENYRRLEVEAKSYKDQNKALTLYIENIIGRLLSHKEFENVLEKSPDLMSSIAQSGTSNKDKELPPPPPAKDDEAAPSLLQRARSVVGGARRPRPMSFMAASTAAPSEADENSSLATNVPMRRSQSGQQDSHRRSQSEMPIAAPIVSHMYRGPPSTGSGGPLSPGISPAAGISRNPFFASATGASNSNATSRAPSGSRFSNERPGSSSNSTFSDKSGDVSAKEKSKSGYTNYTGAVMTQNRLRPLRLVQENREMESNGSEISKADEIAARKKANRASWMPGWFNRPKEDEADPTGHENNTFF